MSKNTAGILVTLGLIIAFVAGAFIPNQPFGMDPQNDMANDIASWCCSAVALLGIVMFFVGAKAYSK